MFGSVYYGVCIPQDLILDNDDKQIQTVFTDKLDAFKVIFSIIIFYILTNVIFNRYKVEGCLSVRPSVP